MKQLLEKLAQEYGYPSRKLTAAEYTDILTKAHNILYGTNH